MTAIIEKRRALLDQMLHVSSEAAPAVGPIPRRAPGQPIPLSFSQERLWFLDKLAPGSPFYTESSALKLAWPVDAQAMERAINAVVERHDVLRTRIYVQDERPLQVAEQVHVPLPVTDLSALAATQQELELERLAVENAMRPFDLQQGPLMRTRLVRLGPANHVFLLALHHIVTDGWSMNVFSREVSAFYRAFAMGQTIALPELPIQYFDYAAWQRGPEHGRALDGQLQYWRDHLRDLPQLELPLDHPRPPMLSYRGSHLEVTIPPNLSAGLRVLSKREQVTLFMSSVAVFAALLHLHTGQSDIVIGTPVAGRNRPELEPLIGIFLNTLVLRFDLSGDPSYRELLRRVKATATATYDRQDIPFDRLVEELQPQRDLGKNPLFQALFQFFTPPDEKTGASAMEAAAVPIDRGTAILDLAYHMWDTPRGIHGRIEFSTELFEPATIERQFEHFLRLLTQVLAHPDRPLSELDTIAPRERAQLLSAWQGTPRVYRETNISSLFAERARAMPDATAAIYGGAPFTYGQLDARANQLANELRERGVQRGDRVAICLDRSPDMISAALAVFRRGAAYVPLDPSYPPQRLAYIVEDARIKAVITTGALSASIASDAPRLFVDGVMSSGEDSRESPAISPLDPAYVIYTSGSTGKPKGVIGLHGATINRFEWMWETFPFAPGEVACQRTAISFVDSVWETFGPLLAGIPLVVVDDETIRDTSSLVRVLAEHRVTRFLTVPSLLQALLDTNPDIGTELPALRLWITSGERLSDELLRRFRRAVPNATLVNLYGSSEVAGDVACATFGPHNEDRVTIGRPLANCRAYVLDSTLRLVPPGIPGDLYVAGAHLARGYFGRSALTAERFLPDPFSSTPGARMYFTGDRVRHLPDGSLEYLGRNDQQVKVRGYRIELGEVESALREHPAVREAAVLMQDDGAGGRLVAYVVTEAAPDELRAFVAQHLPAHMTPAVIVPLYAMPLTPNGKLDRLALHAIGVGSFESADFVAPASEAEAVIAAIWTDLLHVPQVGIHHNFFDLGGHSLLAIRLVSRIRTDLGVELPLRDVFLHPTVAEQARVIEAALLDEIDRLSEDEARERLQNGGTDVV